MLTVLLVTILDFTSVAMLQVLRFCRHCSVGGVDVSQALQALRQTSALVLSSMIVLRQFPMNVTEPAKFPFLQYLTRKVATAVSFWGLLLEYKGLFKNYQSDKVN